MTYRNGRKKMVEVSSLEHLFPTTIADARPPNRLNLTNDKVDKIMQASCVIGNRQKRKTIPIK